MKENIELKSVEEEKRNKLKIEKPYVYEKMVEYKDKVKRGESVAIIQFQYDYRCNFACEHCSANNQMLNTPEKKEKFKNVKTFTHSDIKELFRQGDKLGLANVTITGGEPLTYPDLEDVIKAIDPKKWFIACDTNGWFLDDEKAKWLKSIGIDKIQISLDNLNPDEHDKFRNKPGSFNRVMRAIEASRKADLLINISTVAWKSRIRSGEFREFVEWATKEELPLYVSLAKPVGSYKGQLDEVCNTEDIAYIDELIKDNSLFAHWTPGYGLDFGCIAVKRMVSVTHYGDIMPCPYTHVSLGNFFKEPLKDIIERALKIKLFAYGKKETCYIGNTDHEFIHKYLPKYQDKYNEVYAAPYTEVFEAEDFIDGKMIWSDSFEKNRK